MEFEAASHHYTPWKPAETHEQRLKRLSWQARNRTLISKTIFSTFFEAERDKLTDSDLSELDEILNNDADETIVVEWLVGARPVPAEYNNSVMRRLRAYAATLGRENKLDLHKLKKNDQI